MKISGQLVDIINKRIFPAEIEVSEGKIVSILEMKNVSDQFILPGFIDAHVHIESSMLVPSEFARMAVVHGTVATVSDPHEIANVCGVAGVEYMIENGKQVPFKFYFGAPSCVPATPFETAGAEVTAADIRKLLEKPEVKYLAEMMNWPGVLNRSSEVMEKIQIAHALHKPVDGHAPGLRGEQAKNYAAAGITTDHECFTREEALDKLKLGLKILIREGSAAKNFNALIDLLNDYPDQIMFCSDDKHPDSLEESHINALVKRALNRGIDLFKVLQAACINPITHYKLEVGKLVKGDPADFIVVNNLRDFQIQSTFINGIEVARHGKTCITSVNNTIINNFSTSLKSVNDFKILHAIGNIRVIEALDGQLITNELLIKPLVSGEQIIADVTQDILKIVVVNRYLDSKPSIAFIRNFGLKSGAIASSVAHDSHNIIAVGVDDESICKAVNLIIEARGGVSAVDNNNQMIVKLPVAGLMATADGYEIASQYKAIDQMAKRMGSQLQSPFMTLSFMALLVIPDLKLSDKGLFDGKRFEFVDVVVNE